MPVDKKQHTTLPTEPPTASPLSSPQAFHQQLRDQIRTAVQTVMEEIMREELTQFLGAEWGECTKMRRGYRNGTSTRSLSTSSGPIEELHVPRDREGQFHTQAFDRYSRYEPQVAEGRDGDVRGRSLDRESRRNRPNPDRSCSQQKECEPSQSELD